MPTPRRAAEHRWPLDGGDVIALTLDGIGMGENGALWGGECLRVNYRECEHLGGLPAVALPGDSGGTPAVAKFAGPLFGLCP